MKRTTQDVFEDHLRLRTLQKVEDDIQTNYSDRVCLICEYGVFYGHDAIRTSAARLKDQIPDAKYEFTSKQVADEYALLIWKANSDRFRVEHGADTFVIRNGKIILQTIYYDLIVNNVDFDSRY